MRSNPTKIRAFLRVRVFHLEVIFYPLENSAKNPSLKVNRRSERGRDCWDQVRQRMQWTFDTNCLQVSSKISSKLSSNIIYNQRIEYHLISIYKIHQNSTNWTFFPAFSTFWPHVASREPTVGSGNACGRSLWQLGVEMPGHTIKYL